MATFNLNTVCSQRRAWQMLPAPIRYTSETQTPYPEFTQDQLNMRRKTEILKYKSNASNTKTNSLTKAQQYAQIVNGPNTISNYAIYLNNINNRTCPDDSTIPTPTTSSNVPGPIINLTYNPEIPLYKYVFNENVYSSFSGTQNTKIWDIITQNDLFFQDGVSTKLFSLYILNAIDQASYNYTFQTPFAISIMGNPALTNDISLNRLSLGISNISANVSYSGSQVPGQNIQITPVTPAGQTTMAYNIAHTNTQYLAYQYSGILTISNMILNTSPGFVYDIYLQINMELIDSNIVSRPYSNYYTTDTRGVYCNLSASKIKNSYNTVVTTSASNIAYNGYSLTGI